MVVGEAAPTRVNMFGRTVVVKPKKESMSMRKKRLQEEYDQMMLLRDEVMNQDLERFLMEIEERHSWVAYELNDLNSLRLKKETAVAAIFKAESSKLQIVEQKFSVENGLSFFRGNIVSNKRPQNSAARHLDLSGHTAPINSCKLSKCLTYVLSCSNDKTTRLWLLRTGRTLLTFTGHLKKVNDCDLHKDFQLNLKISSIVTCSGDCTINFYNSITDTPTKILRGHTEPVYRTSFSPNGTCIVSCSEDQTVRTWSFPDGFQLFVFRAHTAPVSTVQFSPSGRYTNAYQYLHF